MFDENKVNLLLKKYGFISPNPNVKIKEINDITIEFTANKNETIYNLKEKLSKLSETIITDLGNQRYEFKTTLEKLTSEIDKYKINLPTLSPEDAKKDEKRKSPLEII